MKIPSPHIAAMALPDKDALEIACGYMLRESERRRKEFPVNKNDVYGTAAACIAFALVCLQKDGDDAM